jgi:hypothetical protein
MAHAKYHQQVTKQVVVSPAEVVLCMTHDEATTLQTILHNIGGSPAHSPRKHQESIKRALQSAGVDMSEAENMLIKTNTRIGAIYFKNYPESGVADDR